MALLVEKPVELYLYQDQLEALESLSEREGKTVVELILRGIDRLLAEPAVETEEPPIEADPLWDIVNLGRSGTSDTSVNHDQYLAEMELNDNR